MSEIKVSGDVTLRELIEKLVKDGVNEIEVLTGGMNNECIYTNRDGGWNAGDEINGSLPNVEVLDESFDGFVCSYEVRDTQWGKQATVQMRPAIHWVYDGESNW